MRNKKEFFGVLISVFVCVFIVALIVYATTTVGNDVSVGGTLTAADKFTGTVASLSQDLTIGSDDISFLQGGEASISSSLWIGVGASVSQDLTIGSDDISFLQGGAASISSTLWVGDLFTGTAASISGDLSVGTNASVSGTFVVNGATIQAGIASMTGSGTVGTLYINTQTGSISFYDSNDDWSPVDDD